MTRAASIPAGPPPTTTTFFGFGGPDEPLAVGSSAEGRVDLAADPSSTTTYREVSQVMQEVQGRTSSSRPS